MLEPFLWMAAVGMGLLTAYTLAYVSDTDRALEVYLGVFVLGMMAAMLGGGLIYLAHPGVSGIETAIWLNMGVMGFLTVPIIRVLVKTALERGELTLYVYTIPYRYLWLIRTLFIGLVLFNELLMGWAFIAVTQGVPIFSVEGGSLIRAFSGIAGSDWFVFIMAVEMAFSAYLIRRLIPKSFLLVVLFQVATMIFSPTAIGVNYWREISVVVDGLVMAGFMLYVFLKLYRGGPLNRNFTSYLYTLVLIYAFMMIGILVWVTTSSELLFSLSLLAQMVLYFRVELEPSTFTAREKRSWLLDAKWSFQ
ncbi:hypothetical protein B9Q04_16005 [Candidatus Marsarchaeota G2 archaeon BE_D]|jgi:hypothetical protein|uniref:Uncharacterized protein n=1 Tax=Candidatus Marsarchaeota G2 archaeon BE_D TaxID=1978158 RepID=A0A2R6C6T3_9ARCH|nr:MAG: hypothetical protein B9Q04_16005 [Candidatus Marsarchaeota G2 archaeon BE_D]